ncbi:hypothetical protein E2C01_083189 [Portunus trituberculatus]|uniref:Uncharacterized protein n=1 Tax=Portunus trituberculatus TaxID=210409 RepID=A0A5B7J131_PORTR|nr:hypothetical protein [Portunus trituberculatus]
MSWSVTAQNWGSHSSLAWKKSFSIVNQTKYTSSYSQLGHSDDREGRGMGQEGKVKVVEGKGLVIEVAEAI